MQRIDENTFIDDTLVTCAEYQLFIDDVCEQGEYYQPDHWTSCQFPAGQAQKPVLGVRHSDALAFCDWLTNREHGKWRFRLLNPVEVLNYSTIVQSQYPVGYWINGANLARFAWVGNAPKDARMIELEIARALDHLRADDLGFVLYGPCNRALDRALNRAVELDLIRDFSADLYLEISRGKYQNYDLQRALDLTTNLIKSFNRNRDLALDIYIDIFTLQKRIHGHSHPFEGIRIVKERIR